MKRKSISIPMYMIIGLALIGLTTQLFTNTISFINSMLISIGVGVILFTVIYFLFIRKKNASNEMKKYKQAVKQSKAKYHQKPVLKATTGREQPTNALRKKRNKRAAHLRVIDGNKHKRKDRASF